MRHFRKFGLAVSFCILSAFAAAATIYVKANASGANDGSSWASAYTELQSALAAALFGDEIWVASGSYKPTNGTDRTISFSMTPGVGVYGGFVGTETQREQRDWSANPTILSGEIGSSSTPSDNSYHVVAGASPGVLDGFTITAGRADSPPESRANGGGMYNDNVSPTIANCTFSGNTGSSHGGGMYNYGGFGAVTNCIFWNNSAAANGEIYKNISANPTLRNCDIRSSGGSGALWNPNLGTDGGGNIMADPLFVNASSPNGEDSIPRTADDGLRLSYGSPCTDAGTSTGAPATDILGNPRIGITDIGAYEQGELSGASDWMRYR